MIKIAIILAGLSLLTMACTSPSKKANNSAGQVVKTAKVLETEKKNKEREEEMQDIRDRNRIINAKNQSGKAPTSPIAVVPKPHEFTVSAKPQNQKLEILPQANILPKSDYELYQDMQVQYEQNNQIAFFSRMQVFQKQFPNSHLMDEVLYLGGLMSLSNKNYGASLKYFNQIATQFPISSKSSAAVFAKGVALKKMNLKDQAKNVFVGVIKKYPGSVEAARAGNELKLLR